MNNFYVIGGKVLCGTISAIKLLFLLAYLNTVECMYCTLWNIYSHPFANIHNIVWLEQDWPLTSACCVHSNVYGLGNIHSIRYLTVIDPFHSTSSAVQTYHHLMSGSVEIIISIATGYSTFIGEEPVPKGRPHNSSIRRSTTSCLVSYAE